MNTDKDFCKKYTAFCDRCLAAVPFAGNISAVIVDAFAEWVHVLFISPSRDETIEDVKTQLTKTSGKEIFGCILIVNVRKRNKLKEFLLDRYVSEIKKADFKVCITIMIIGRRVYLCSQESDHAVPELLTEEIYHSLVCRFAVELYSTENYVDHDYTFSSK